jgi:triosephosphate isomerase
MRIPFVAGNWKMFKTVHEAVLYAKEFRALAPGLEGVDVVLAPPFTAVHAVAEAVRNTAVGVAAQDLYWEAEGAFTGEISAQMIKEAGAQFVIIGHSERRTLFGETDASVNRKTAAAVAADLTPIVCIGETLDQRDSDETTAVLDRQIKEGFAGLTSTQVAGLVVAYEPVWAIGTGRVATPEQAASAHAHIRGRIRESFGASAADQCHLIYGGSVKPDNVRALMASGDVDGTLVGGASLTVGAFADIVAGSRPTTV